MQKPQSKVKLDRNLSLPLTVAGGVFALIITAVLFFPGSFLSKLYYLSGAVCAQRPAHSNFFNGEQLPVETRMVGIFCGFALTWFVLWFVGRGRDIKLPPRPLAIVFSVFVLVMVADGLNATFWDWGFVTLYEPQNWLRLITGTLSGIGMAALIMPIYNQVVWKQTYKRPSVRTWGELAGLTFGIGGAIILTTISGWGGFFWILAVVSMAGLLAMLVILNLIVYYGFFRQNKQARDFYDLLIPFCLLLLFSLIELTIVASGRVAVIGSPFNF
jgi:uncharacterized membrane protein